MSGENIFLLHSVWFGVYITLVYDLLRILRRVIKHSSFAVSLEDLLFWIYCAEEVFLLMYRESDGTLRWFAIGGALFSMFLYRKLVSPWLVKGAAFVLNKLFGCIGKILSVPLRLFKVFLRPLNRLRELLRRQTRRAAHARHLAAIRAAERRRRFFHKLQKRHKEE